MYYVVIINLFLNFIASDTDLAACFRLSRQMLKYYLDTKKQRCIPQLFLLTIRDHLHIYSKTCTFCSWNNVVNL